jgi:hypothetical protein
MLVMHNIYTVLFYGMQQDRQCTYDAKLRHVRATIVAVEKQ